MIRILRGIRTKNIRQKSTFLWRRWVSLVYLVWLVFNCRNKKTRFSSYKSSVNSLRLGFLIGQEKLFVGQFAGDKRYLAQQNTKTKTHFYFWLVASVLNFVVSNTKHTSRQWIVCLKKQNNLYFWNFHFLFIPPFSPLNGKKIIRRFCNRAGIMAIYACAVEVMWCVCNEVKPFFNYIYLTRPTLCNWYCQIGRGV